MNEEALADRKFDNNNNKKNKKNMNNVSGHWGPVHPSQVQQVNCSLSYSNGKCNLIKYTALILVFLNIDDIVVIIDSCGK